MSTTLLLLLSTGVLAVKDKRDTSLPRFSCGLLYVAMTVPVFICRVLNRFYRIASFAADDMDTTDTPVIVPVVSTENTWLEANCEKLDEVQQPHCVIPEDFEATEKYELVPQRDENKKNATRISNEDKKVGISCAMALFAVVQKSCDSPCIPQKLSQYSASGLSPPTFSN